MKFWSLYIGWYQPSGVIYYWLVSAEWRHLLLVGISRVASFIIGWYQPSGVIYYWLVSAEWRHLLLGCHGLPSLKMGLVFFFSSEQFLRNIACIRLKNDAGTV